MIEKLEGQSKRGGKRPGSGRKKGKPNTITALLKDAVLQAATNAGGAEGLVGYLQTQAVLNAGPFMGLLGKVLPMQLAGDPENPIAIRNVGARDLIAERISGITSDTETRDDPPRTH